MVRFRLRSLFVLTAIFSVPLALASVLVPELWAAREDAAVSRELYGSLKSAAVILASMLAGTLLVRISIQLAHRARK